MQKVEPGKRCGGVVKRPKTAVCKTAIHRFKSDRRLQVLKLHLLEYRDSQQVEPVFEHLGEPSDQLETAFAQLRFDRV